MHTESQATNSVLTIGLMSGTSADGVDAALVRTDGQGELEFHYAITHPYEHDMRGRLLVAAREDLPTLDLLQLERELTAWHVAACRELLSQSGTELDQIELVGFHGHTVRHVPNEGLTLQLGDPSLIAEAIGCRVVSDFRRRDLAAGGEGAPLAPLFHQKFCQRSNAPTVVLNLGGVGNVTWLTGDEIAAGDTGPGCGLLDQWAQSKVGEPYDRDGKLAASGTVSEEAVAVALTHPFFQRPLPKSADRFEFETILNLNEIQRLSLSDGAATLCAVTVAAVAMTVERLEQSLDTVIVYVTGGGAHHPVLMSMLRERFHYAVPIEEAGLRADSLEAECFAWLAVRRLYELPTSLPATTGCRQATSGGLITF